MFSWRNAALRDLIVQVALLAGERLRSLCVSSSCFWMGLSQQAVTGWWVGFHIEDEDDPREGRSGCVPPADFRGGDFVEVASTIQRRGYKLEMQTDGGATFVRRYSPVIFFIVYVLFFPLGLLLLVARPTQNLSITFGEGEEAGTTSWSVIGTDERMREVFEALGGVDTRSAA